MKILILWMEEEILHHLDGWNPLQNNGIFATNQLVQAFATIHSRFWLMTKNCFRMWSGVVPLVNNNTYYVFGISVFVTLS